MRRFFIWSALAALIGLILAGGVYWAYWNFHARFQPVVIARGQAEIQRLLDEASWVSPGGGGEPVYVVTYRDSAAGQRYEAEEFDKLSAGGAEPRVIVFARADREGLEQSTPAERATVAELWLTRDWALYARWTATPVRNWTAAGVPEADGNLARSAVVEASREFVNRLGALLQEAGVPNGYPVVLWRDREGFLKACACSDSRSWAFIRDDLGAPDRVGDPALPPAVGDPLSDEAPTYPAAPAPGAPYPDLPVIPPLENGEAPGAAPSPGATSPGSAPSGAAPAPRRPAAPANPPPPPKAERQDETTFF